jgi:DNA-binding MarR family transcriptional regulator
MVVSFLTLSASFGLRLFLIAKDKGVSRDRQALIAAVGHATQAYQRATDGFDDAVGRRLGLNPTDLRCLDWLSERAMAAGELGEATGLSSAATTTMLDRLERKGYARRERDTVDRRKVLVEMTPHGRELIGELYGPLVREGSVLLVRFSDDELAMIRDFLREATQLVDRQRARLRGSPLPQLLDLAVAEGFDLIS